MTDKERLENIKEQWKNGYPVTAGSNEEPQLHRDFEWLIEQAERVQELEKVRKTLSDNHFQQIEQHKYLVQQNKELREALVETSRIIENIKDIWRVKE